MAVEYELYPNPEERGSEDYHTLEWISTVLAERSIHSDAAQLYHIAATGLSREDLAYITHGLGLDVSGDVAGVFDRIKTAADELTREGLEDLNRLITALEEPVYLETEEEDLGKQRLAGFTGDGAELLPVNDQGEVIEGAPFRLHYGSRHIRQW